MVNTTSLMWGDDSKVAGGALAGVYVTASIWENCKTEKCVGSASKTEIHPFPKQWIPLSVLEKEVETYSLVPDDYVNFGVATFEGTSTAKLFFPQGKLKANRNYYVTLEIMAEVKARAHACYGHSMASVFAEATLGPHTIDVQVLNDAIYGRCTALKEGSDSGCDIFDSDCRRRNL